MKKLLVLCLLVSGTAFAGQYGTAGCGLGSIVLGNKPGIIQIFAATLNGTSGNQTFGITSGTSNCGKGVSKLSSANFIEANKVSLKNDLSRGNGETLSALGEIYGVSNTERMNETLKANYKFISASNDANVMDKRISETLRKNNLI